MLDQRKSAILKTIVTEHIQTAQPVGSAHVVRDPAIGVSTATVRADMAALEREGYLTHPHTSAGRIPTDKGYRFFVDNLCSDEPLEPIELQQVRDFFQAAHGELEQTLRDTSKLLSELTKYAAVVIGPDHEDLTARSAMIVRLAGNLALLVIVLSNGTVEKHTIELAGEDPDSAFETASNRLNAHLVGRTLGKIEAPARSGDASVDALIGACMPAIGELGDTSTSENVYIKGAARMADAFDAVDTVRSVLTILEQSYVVVTLLQGVLDQEKRVAIGVEHGLAPLAECSVVVAPYEVGNDVGTIGVLGPTRMNYPQALASVAVVSQRLSRELSRG